MNNVMQLLRTKFSSINLVARVGLAVCLCALAAECHAADRVWRNANGGTFSNPGNWAGGLVAGPGDAAHFGIMTGPFPPITYTVDFSADATNQALVVEDDRVTFDLNGNVYTTTLTTGTEIGNVAGRSGRLTITDGVVDLAPHAQLLVGSAANGFGVLTVSTGGMLDADSPERTGLLVLGRFGGSGTLTVNDAGVVESDFSLIGDSASSTGTATVTGANSLWFNFGALDVGFNGQGTLAITDGGQVRNTAGKVARNAGSGGSVMVSGLSQWLNSESLTIGHNSHGTLSVEGGAMVRNTDGIVGALAGGTGEVTVAGASPTGIRSLWLNTNELSVGLAGTGTLQITDGGRVENTAGFIGRNADSTGEVTVSGTNSEWTNSGDLFVGYEGEGTLNITAGGRVESALLSIGDRGDAYLAIEAGGRVENMNSVVGRSGGSNGTVNVTGDDSEWFNSGHVAIGGHGTGELRISAGASVRSTSGTIGVGGNLPPSGRGFVQVQGAGSQWINEGRLEVGFLTSSTPLDPDTLNILDGALVQNQDASIGETFASGRVHVSGENSRWINRGALSIGGCPIPSCPGHGTLLIDNGGRVESSQGTISGGSMVTVDGANSVWDLTINGGDLIVADAGGGALLITNGGWVASGNADVGVGDFSFASVTVSGASPVGVDSRWDIEERLSIGTVASSPGLSSLRIGVGGTVSVAQNTVLFARGSLRLEGGTLETTAISFNGGGDFDWTSGVLHVGDFFGNLVNEGGTLAPGRSAGETVILGDYTQQAAATLEIEIGGPTLGTQYDFVDIEGAAMLDGELELKLIGGFVPTSTQTFLVLDAIDLVGAFDNVASGGRLATTDGAGSFLVQYAFNQIILSDFQAGLTGDYNLNGIVDAADYTLWQDTLGSTTALAADGDASGTVDAGDYDVWKTNFGSLAGSNAADAVTSSLPVPEPSSAFLLLGGIMLALFRRGG